MLLSTREKNVTIWKSLRSQNNTFVTLACFQGSYECDTFLITSQRTYLEYFMSYRISSGKITLLPLYKLKLLTKVKKAFLRIKFRYTFKNTFMMGKFILVMSIRVMVLMIFREHINTYLNLFRNLFKQYTCHEHALFLFASEIQFFNVI